MQQEKTMRLRVETSTKTQQRQCHRQTPPSVAKGDRCDLRQITSECSTKATEDDNSQGIHRRRA